MPSESFATVIAAVIAALAALGGYLANQFANRREQRIGMYAEALRALGTYQDIPYRIVRRPNSEPETRERLGILLSEAVSQVRFYESWLQIHSPEVGAAYALLFRRIRQLARSHMANAWRRAVILTDSELSEPPHYPYLRETREERQLVLLAMQADLSPFSSFRMWRIRNRIHQLISKEPNTPSSLMGV
jgi:hypothetical protein